MRKLMVMCTMALTSVCLAQTTNDTMNKEESVEAKFNPMTMDGKRRLQQEAEKIVMTRLINVDNCVVALCDDDGFPITRWWNGDIKFTPWNVMEGKDYVEIGRSRRSFRRYSPDGRLKAVGDFWALCAEERKVLQAKYLKEFGMTEDEAKKIADKNDATNYPPRVMGGLARLRQQRMEAGEKQYTAEERAQQRDALLQIQEQLRTQRQEREAAAREKQELLGKKYAKMAEEETERKKFFPPLMPFAEAVEKAKNGDGAALYALALHYAKGEEISQDKEKARLYLKKAADVDYPAAVLIYANSKEGEMISGFGGSDIDPETGGRKRGLRTISFVKWRRKDPISDVENVEAIRNGYKKAAALGLSIATNKLARFEKRIAEIKADADRKAKNEALAKELE